MSKLLIKERFGITPNEILNSKQLSLKAKGLFAYIQSKPDGRNFSAKNISIQCKENIDSIKTGLKELENYGLLERIKTHDKKGFRGIEYILKSQICPGVENPSTDNPSTEKGTNISNKEISKKDNSKKEINKLHFLEKKGLSFDFINFEYKDKKKGKLLWSPEHIEYLIDLQDQIQRDYGIQPNYSRRTMKILSQVSKDEKDFWDKVETELSDDFIEDTNLEEYLDIGFTDYPFMSEQRRN